MGKGTAELFDAVDTEVTAYSPIDWVVWLLMQAGAFASALVLFLTKRAMDANPALRVDDAIKENLVVSHA
jgi:hypothetical protein